MSIARINEMSGIEPQVYENVKVGFSCCQKQGRRFHFEDVCIVKNEIEVFCLHKQNVKKRM